MAGKPAHNALARIGAAATLPGREPHASGFCGADQSSIRLRFDREIYPATLNSVELSNAVRRRNIICTTISMKNASARISKRE